MEQDLWHKVEEIFHAALDSTPEDRAAYLDRVCGGDAELRRKVESLLSDADRAESFLENPALEHKPDGQTTAEFSVNRQIGPFRIVSPLGSGGMGEVYRAHDNKLGRDVALKALPREFARDPERLARFRREARALASLNHPNIAAIYGLEESGEADCLVLELVEGEILHGPLPEKTAIEYARQVAEALEAAHGKGIIHRDLKPANVMVTPQGRVKVLDFGLAKAILGPEVNQDLSQLATTTSPGTLAGNIVGTPGYMSPEQARGKEVDKRTDIWAFGCLFYELLTGKRAFQGESPRDTIAAVLEREPDWQALPPKTPQRIRELLRRCLQKDVARRLPDIPAARETIEKELRGWNRWRMAAIAAGLLAVAVLAAATLSPRRPARPSESSQWIPVTKFADSVTQPALSPDGRMVAFIRGDSTFFGHGQIYVKILPDGEPVQLTHDEVSKMSPAFSPDAARIAYTTVDAGFKWDTWVVPVLGGEPQRWLRNASGLVWSGPGQLLFSEIKMGIHMAVVSAQEGRVGQHDIYVPAEEPSMAHRSYLSPDGKWVLLVEMGMDHTWTPCRVVPADGSSTGHKVGPPGGGCNFGAWSPDGKWMYLTSNAVGGNHIWRQRFPNGEPEQITSGPTEEEGVAMAPDGRSFITASALQNASLWLHDGSSERQISLEGNAADPRFTTDGTKVCFRVVREAPDEFIFYRDAGEVRVADLKSGRSDALVPGFEALDYDLSPDGRQVVMEIRDSAGKPRLWLAPLDRSASPKQIPGVEGTAPRFSPGGEVFFRRQEERPDLQSTSGFIYRVRTDGTGMRKAFDQQVDIFGTISPDGRWALAFAPLPGNGPPTVQAFPLEGGSPVAVVGSASGIGWAPGGGSFYMGPAFPPFGTYIIPLRRGEVLPRIPAGGFHSDEELLRLPGVRRIDVPRVVPGATPDVYAFYRGKTQRNLYRIPIP